MTAAPMKLGSVMRGVSPLEHIPESVDASVIEITGLAYDSRRVRPGDLFFAIPGFKSDGHDFVPDAVAAGAVAVCVERRLDGVSAPQCIVQNIRLVMALAASNFNRRPSYSMTLIGVTGTNGKTTTTYLIDEILRSIGSPSGVIGGVEYRIGSQAIPASRTTPESVDIQRMLAMMVERDAEVATIEVSSHGIELSRVAFLDFDVAVFTNLSHDHLDLHEDMERYFRAKRRLFLGALEFEQRESPPGMRPLGVLNIDDPYGLRLADELEDKITYGLTPKADISAGRITPEEWGSMFTLVTPEGLAPVRLRLHGEYNVMNALAAAGVAYSMGLRAPAIAAGLSSFRGVPGRFELVTESPFRVIVDYAHNEAGLTRALTAAADLTEGKLITVFGCPGERDKEKRPGMGEIAGRLSDIAILTTDDCYGEAPDEILDSVEAGLKKSGKQYQRFEDRRKAIETALSAAAPGDTVFIAGKGHETVQIKAEGAVPFSDRQVVKELLGD
jgi:UDP-N-acetylmuramoyl-L-alanyl-D-glutamate--2,6-diaminopimelate ligase